ncbi:MAG: U32 family peptidase [Porticoccaceae bacterium]|jgi:putative protease|nr:U32 family peptidase [Porticoccaceae bacterium]
MELLCPAGNIPSLKAAIKAGADAVYVGLNNDTNARHFTGLNLSGEKLREAADYVHAANRKLHVAINTFAHPNQMERWQDSVDQAISAQADVLILADIAVLDYVHNTHPHQEVHLSVQASATNAGAIEFYKRQFGVKRIVLPRVLSIHQVKMLKSQCDIDLEVFAFGSLCVMAEGRCYLSSYVTGESPNTSGVCSPARFVEWQDKPQGLSTRLNGVLIDNYKSGEQAGYPTLCKGRFCAGTDTYHVLEEPTSLNTLDLLPELYQLGISSLKIEGRQRSAAYVAEVTRVWRNAIDAVMANRFSVKQEWQAALEQLSEGYQTTLGAYHRKWK